MRLTKLYLQKFCIVALDSFGSLLFIKTHMYVRREEREKRIEREERERKRRKRERKGEKEKRGKE